MSESEAQGTEEAAPHIFLFLSVTFTIGVIIKNLMANTKIPYTVVIFVLGILVGVGGTYSPAFREYLVIDTIPPTFIFYIFFPILIFEGSFDWEIKVFREVFFQTIILAFPGLVIATAITAVICKYVMYPGWGWTTALLYGSIISATDPVATVSMMKQLGVSKYIVGMIDGEALLNDGAAIVIYAILLPSVVSGSTDALSVGSVVVSFLRLVFGAVTLGVVMGFALVLFLEHMHREAPLKATITLFVSVLVFYIADYAAKFSGVLALVSCGLVLSYFRYSVRPEEAHVLHAFWEILVYMANTLIFALVGLLIGIEAFTNVKAADVGKLFVLYATIHVSRAVVLILAWPLLNLKASTSWKTILFSTMTGLRGAVGLTLALAINQNNEIDADVRAQFLFLTAGIVILTIVVNGLGGLLLVDVLKLDRKSPERKLIMSLSWRAIQKGLTNHIALSKTIPGMEAANWGIVRHSTSDVFRDPYSGLEPIPYLMHSDRVRILHRAYVRRLLNNARVRFEKGLLTSRSFASYRYELEHVMHQNNVVSFDENIRCLWAICSFSFPFDTAVKTLLTRILRRVPQFMSTLHCREFEICLAYYHGLESLLHDFPIHLDAGIESRLLQIAQEELDRVGQHLRWIQNRSDGSGDLDHMSTQLVCNQVLHRAQTRLKELEDLGFLPPKDINVIAEELEHLLEKIASSRNIQTSSARAFFNLEMVRTLDPEKKSKLFEHVTERIVRKSCCCETDECSEVAIVSTGLIQIRSFEADMQHTHGEGYVLNWGKKDAPDATAVAITEVTLFIIPKEVLQSFAQENVDVDTALWVQVGIQSALHLLSSISPFSSMAPLRRDEVCCHGFLFECSAGTWTMNTSCAGYLILRGGEHADDAGHQVSTCNVVLSPIHLTNTVTSPTGSGKPNSLRDGTILATNRVSSNTDTVAGHHLQITLTDETLIFVVPVPASEAGLDDLHHDSSTFIVFKSQSTNEEKLEYSVRGEHEIALQIPSVEKRRAGVRRVHSVIRQKFSKLEWPQRNEKEKENEVNTLLIDTQKAPSDTTTSRHEDEKEA